MTTINLRIPGPTPLPPEVLKALSKQMISHRSGEYRALHQEVAAGVQKFFQTKNDVFLFTSSGTGTMEAAIVNTLSPGDKALGVTIGIFGDRFMEVAKAYGIDLTILKFPMGTAADPEKVAEAFAKIKDCKAILITHNETSTAIVNDLAAITKAISLSLRGASPQATRQSHVHNANRQEIASPRQLAGSRNDIQMPLFLVDAVSSMGNVDIPVDELGLDVVFTSSQKAWMAPPGIAMVSVSSRAWEASKTAKCPRYYFDFAHMKKYHDRGETPETPAISTLFALQAALKLMLARGVKETFAYYADLARYTRKTLADHGFVLFGDQSHASNTVTAIEVPKGVTDEDFRGLLKKKYGLILSGGKGEVKGKIVRIAHLGWLGREDIDAAIQSMVKARSELVGR
ncbi:alanine--glyoxylate aminotransferase family protein [Candidatus Gottesmanbacteria bacterium]|nr:alanine--glyoxylate aminotransferase family protein [Candidatus Gottesmanbacteria bacterium]